jgi:hypothetical protein
MTADAVSSAPRKRKHLQIVYPDIPARRSIFKGLDVSEKPRFNVTEVAKFFFGRSSHWVRWKEKEGDLSLNGKLVADHRNDGGARYYTLSDVEQMAHALCRNGAIDSFQLQHVLRLVYTEAQVWGYLPPNPAQPEE